MSRRDIMGQIAVEIRGADRCDAFTADGECCDGLEGCERCLANAAEAVLDLAYRLALARQRRGSGVSVRVPRSDLGRLL